MSAEPLISVIVPIYNVEAYLERCIKSIVNQSYRNLEIILVDDGSPDRCPEICDCWGQLDSRIKVVHKENGGLSSARNAGMAIATGELIGFVDSDDWIRRDMYELLYNNMLKYSSDISACGIQLVFEDGSLPRTLTEDGCCFLRKLEAMEALISESWLKQPVVHKLYKAKLIRTIPFPVGKYHEDVFWSFRAIGNADCVSVINDLCYYYTQRSGSIMGEGYSIKRFDALSAKKERMEYVNKFFPQLKAVASHDFLFSAVYAMQQTLLHLTGEEQRSMKKRIIEVYLEGKPYYRNPKLPLKQCVWFYMAVMFFERTCRLRNFLKIGI